MALTLHYEKRDKKTKASAWRRAGKLPAVFYGKRTPSTLIALALREFEKVWKRAGENTVVNLLTGNNEEVPALIREVEKHPVTGVVRHADFYVFEKGQKLKIKIPIEFRGVSPVVKDLGAVLVKVMYDLEVEAAPQNLPQKIEVDISSLTAFGNVITAKEIKLPEGVLLVVSPDDIVASVYEPKEEVVEEVPADLSQIEVAKKGKEVKEGEVVPAADAAGGEAKEVKKEEMKKG